MTDKSVLEGEQSVQKNWVKFEEDESSPPPFTQTEEPATLQVHSMSESNQYSGAVINPETVHINIDKNTRRSLNQEHNDVSRAASEPPGGSSKVTSRTSNVSPVASSDTKINMGTALSAQNLQNIDLGDQANSGTGGGGGGSTCSSSNHTVIGTHGGSVIGQGFANGDVIVTLLPINTRWPWITPAEFRPELVPEELMAQGLTLTVEEYVQAMEKLVNDVRFSAYNVCYKRILVGWIILAFVVLLALLFSGVQGILLFGCGIIWLLFNAGAIFFCMWIKIKLNCYLERCMAGVNKNLLKHKILLGLDDRGKISCHKVNLCFIYFDTTACIKKLQEFIEQEEQQGRQVNSEESKEEKQRRKHFQSRMDIIDTDIIITGSNNTRISRKQERAEMLLLRYSHRWVKQLVRKHLDLSIDVHDREEGSLPTPPRHCVTDRCPCQFIEEHLRYKNTGKFGLRCLCCCDLPDFGFD